MLGNDSVGASSGIIMSGVVRGNGWIGIQLEDHCIMRNRQVEWFGLDCWLRMEGSEGVPRMNIYVKVEARATRNGRA